MNAKVRVHAAKIPERLQGRDKYVRMLAGDLLYVNACNDKPWKTIPEGLSPTDVEVCLACKLIMDENRNRNVKG